ncbi:hypothetical protein NBRC116594_31360 [Shimia sp. NS0008-38b]|uniref:phosphotransferase n=1 Tax=Shimia sp. NS0008-38b TaxID=3127653 RepID=UPI00310C5BB1
MISPPIDQWGVCAELSALEGGHRNEVWRTHGLDQNVVFKSTRRDEASVAWLVPVLDNAGKCGLHVPSLKTSRSGRWVCDGWTCETFIEGAHITRDELSELSASLSRFHASMQGISQRPGFLSSSALMTAHCGGDVDLTRMPSDLVALCRASWGEVIGDVGTVVHGDLSPSNVLRRPDGGLSVVDWDECRCDFVLFDRVPFGQVTEAERRAHLAWELACSWKREPAYARDLAEMLRNS